MAAEDEGHPSGLELLVAKDQIRDLVARYSYATDTNRVDLLVDLFTEDCVFDAGPGSGGPTRGRESVGAMRRRSSVLSSSHHNENVLVDFLGPDRARVRSTYHAWHRTASGEPTVWGYYDDVVVRRDGGWLFEERVIRIYGEHGFDAVWNPGERL